MGRKFINHSNKKENLVLTLESVKKEYSPYEDLEVILKVYNISNSDTMYLYKPDLFNFPYRELVIRDSLNNRVPTQEGWTLIDTYTKVDDYGRIIEPTIAPENQKLAPRDSLVIKFIFQTGKRIYNEVGFIRENIPGSYKTYYEQYHEEYDEIKGPLPVIINSPSIIYQIRNYSNEELEGKKEAMKIISVVESGADSLMIDSLYTKFKLNLPENVYVPMIGYYLEQYYFYKNYEETEEECY